MNYPGHVLQQGAEESSIITAVQAQLNSKGCGPVALTSVYDEATTAAVGLFQSRFADVHGAPLFVDGKLGPVTWASLFGTASVGNITLAPNPLLNAVLDVARSQIGVMEMPAGSNSGPQVNIYLKSVDCPPGNSWCMSFVYWCFNQACHNMGRATNPLVRTAGVLEGWNKATCKKIKAADAQHQTDLVKPGQIFILSTGGGHGHTGLIEKIEGGLMTTIEGNTNNDGSREGIGVFRRAARRINSINTGFLEYS